MLSREDERIVVAPTAASSEDERAKIKLRGDNSRPETGDEVQRLRSETNESQSFRPRETKTKTIGREIKMPKLQADRDQGHE